MEVGYRRTTLADTLEELSRVTLDWRVQCTLDGERVWLDHGYVLVETKGGLRPGRADRLLAELGARPRSFSKYVAAASLMRDDLHDNDVRALHGRELHLERACMRSRLPRRYLAVLVLALVAILVGAAGPLVFSALANPSAKDLIAADPPPRLFPAATVAPLEKQVTAQSAQAHALMQQWWATHDHAAHDAAFTAWLEKTLPGPPSATQRTAEVADVSALARTRTPAGVRASTWLETHGKKDVWKLYAHDQAELLPQPTATPASRRSRTCSSCPRPSRTRSARSTSSRRPTCSTRRCAPITSWPRARSARVPTPRGTQRRAPRPRRTSPRVDPHRASEYAWMQAEIDYSRVYMAGHTVSDVTGGALLGDLIGEYFSVTRR